VRRASFAYVIVFIAVGASSPNLSLYYRSLGISLGQIGALMAFTSAVALLSAPAWGAVHDRFPRSFVLLPVAGTMAGLGAFGLATVGATPLLIVSAATFAVGNAGIVPMMDVRVLELTGSDRTRYGRVRAFGSASFMVFAPLVGILVQTRGIGAFFLVMIPALVIGGFVATSVPGRTNVVRAPSMLRAPDRVLRHRPILLFLIGSLVCWTAISAQQSFFSLYFQSLGGSNEQIGWAWAIGAALEVPTMITFPILARRFGVERLILAGAAITVSRQIANVVFLVPTVLLACSIVQGAGYGLLVVGGVTFVSRQAPRGTAATAQGLLGAVTVSSAAILATGVGGQLAGLLGIHGLYVIAMCLGILGVAMLAFAVLPVSARESAERAAAELVIEPSAEIGV
jgi:MFS transporter, PPP family, 3-phenylpropionic acid transporter